MYIINVIGMWLVRIDHRNIIKAAVTQINSLWNTILSLAANHNWERTILFGKFSNFNTIRYEWADRHYLKEKYG